MASNPLPLLVAAAGAFFLMKAAKGGEKSQGVIEGTVAAGVALVYKWSHSESDGKFLWEVKEFEGDELTEEKSGSSDSAKNAMLAIQDAIEDMRCIIDLLVTPQQPPENLASLKERLDAGESAAALSGNSGATFHLDADAMNQIRTMAIGDSFTMKDFTAGDLTIKKICQ